MRQALKNCYITGILAVIFFISSHFFIIEYNDYNINHKKLSLLRGQEQFLKKQIKEFEKKKQILVRVKNFFDQARQSGLTKDKWDMFYVNLKNHPLSFLNLQTILAQTSNCRQYYFKPDSLSIKMGNIKNNVSQPEKPANSKDLESNQKSSDVIISLNGHFLVKHRGLPDG